jgi:hypothetical protein
MPSIEILLISLPEESATLLLLSKWRGNMKITLVDIGDARARLATDEQPYGFQISDSTLLLGPACQFGANHLRDLKTKGDYAENFEEATLITDAKGVQITGIWFVKG